jgi:Rrf2 family protein
MKISTKGRYGLRALLDLAANSASGHVALNSIAERQQVSENYLEQVFSQLRKAGLVKSVKGAQGGYTVSGSLANITIGQVLRTLEGDLSVVENGTELDPGLCNKADEIINTMVWRRIDESIAKVVDKVTLEELIIESKLLQSSESMMYFI